MILIFTSLLSSGQGTSIVPSYFPEYVYGSWVDEDNKLVLIITKNYIVINNELYNYYEVVKENDRIDFTCVNYYFKIKYVNTLKISASQILFDEGFKTAYLTKLASENISQIPNFLVDNWYKDENKIELKENDVLFSNNSYQIDYIASSNNANYSIVVYFDGNYSLIYNTINNKTQYLNTNFSKPILFKKASFYKKNKNLLFFIVVILALLLSYYLINKNIAKAKKREEVKRKLTEMQLKGIRSQMNPHFLFNALSAIQNLINQGENEKANHYLTEFSQLMRLTLDKSEQGIVSLSDELTSIKKYLELEKLRFNFDYTIKISPELNINTTEIPAMLIQPFVENSIIHGLIEKSGSKSLNLEFKKINNSKFKL